MRSAAIADLGSALLMVLAGSLLGLLWNPSALRPRQLELEQGEGEGRPGQAAWLGTIDRAELLEALGAGRLQVVDARPRSEYEAGHLPGSLPAWDQGPTDLFDLLLALVDPEVGLVVVDEEGDGFAAKRLAFSFRARGAREVRLLVGGLGGWRAEGLPLATGWDLDAEALRREVGR